MVNFRLALKRMKAGSRDEVPAMFEILPGDVIGLCVEIEVEIRITRQTCTCTDLLVASNSVDQ